MLAALTAAFMTQLDATIANVALPHMQASTSASREQISWVLTSYIIMAAIFTPLSGWLAGRIGRKTVMLGSVVGFTAASALCGMAQTLEQLIAFRLLQGMMGSALLPMSQAILLDINPPEKHGSAMAMWGMGAVLGPIIGPLAGGWLTESLNWRWVFYINLPFGIIAFLGLAFFMAEPERRPGLRLDLFGFGLLAVAIGAFQLMLDRGQSQDWFQSREICLEAAIAGAALYGVVVHSLTARRPFVNPALFRDANYVVGNIFGFFLGGLMYGVVALIAPMLAELMNYPIALVGMVTAPRGLGTMMAMLVVGKAINHVDGRALIFAGLVLCGISTWMMSGVSLEMDGTLLIASGFVQGVGAGVMFVPITTLVFATIKGQLRNEGAAMNSLIRNLGGAVWISILQTVTVRNEAVVHSRLAERVRPDNPLLGWRFPGMDLASPRALMAMDGEVGRQALMVSYADSFWLLFLLCVVVAPFVLLMRPAAKSG